jgi:hypothetical protein
LQIAEPDWDFLALCVVLVCRDALSAHPDDAGRWRNLDSALAYIGAQARQGNDGDLTLCILADFSEGPSRRALLSRARVLVSELPDPVLRWMTERAGAMVDRVCPDQGFRFRAILTVVSMMVSGELEPSIDFMLSDGGITP